MTKAETAKILAVLAAAYPRFSVDELKLTVWHEMLEDLDYPLLALAIKHCILQQTFAPSIAEVRSTAVELMYPHRKGAADAWAEVAAAVKKYGIHQCGFTAGMSPLLKRAVDALGWHTICLTTKPDIMRSQFMKIYEEMHEQETKDLLLPPDLKKQVQAIGDRRYISPAH